MAKERLGVVFGGKSVEHEVSVVSAMDLLQYADRDRFDIVPFGVTGEGRWLTPDETRSQLSTPEAAFAKRMTGDHPRLLQRPDVMSEIASCDVMFPLIHGVNGEDGTLQGMLEMFGVPYVGCGVAASAIGMDKGLQKQLFERAGLNVGRYLTIRSHEWERQESGITHSIESAVGYPSFVKPSNGGSSVGVTKVRSREDLGGAMAAAFGLDTKVLVETAIEGREVDCGVLGNEEPEASPVGEVKVTGDFYDYQAKYLDDSARLEAPADLPAEKTAEVRQSAVRAFKAIEGAGFSRVDFFLEKTGRVVINEINTLPGFRPVSMFPLLWDKAGLGYSALISRLVDLALARWRGKEASRG